MKHGTRVDDAPAASLQEMKELLTVVIPARNEEHTIAALVRECGGMAHQVIVIDGHSSDATRRLAQECGAKVIQDGGRGKGEAIRRSIAEIRTPFVVFIDADGSHLPQDIPRLLGPLLLDRCDHVSGSRLIGGSSELHGGFDEFLRLAGSSFITAMINWRFDVCLSESQNGFRALKSDVLRSLDLKEDITTIEQEMIIKTLRAGFRMGEVPTHEYRRQFGSSSINVWKVAHRYVWTLVKYLCA